MAASFLASWQATPYPDGHDVARGDRNATDIGLIIDEILIDGVNLREMGTVHEVSPPDRVTLDVSALGDTNDFYNDWTIKITSGPGAGQSRLITDYDGATRVADVSPDWPGGDEPDATSDYTLYPPSNWEFYFNAFEARCLELAGDEPTFAEATSGGVSDQFVEDVNTGAYHGWKDRFNRDYNGYRMFEAIARLFVWAMDYVKGSELPLLEIQIRAEWLDLFNPPGATERAEHLDDAISHFIDSLGLD